MELGLSLSGGGIKGAAHIGALAAIEEEKIKINYISGTSSGSIVASLYSMGYSPEEIYSIFKKYCKKIKYVKIANILKLIYGLIIKREIIISGLNNGKEIELLLKKYSRKKGIINIEDINLPLVIPSVNLQDGSVCIFSSIKKRRILF